MHDYTIEEVAESFEGCDLRLDPLCGECFEPIEGVNKLVCEKCKMDFHLKC